MTGIGNLYSLYLSWRGVTAGDRVVIKDNATPIMEVILNDANSAQTINLPAVGIEFGTSLVISPVLTGGELNITVGYAGNG